MKTLVLFTLIFPTAGLAELVRENLFTYEYSKLVDGLPVHDTSKLFYDVHYKNDCKFTGSNPNSDLAPWNNWDEEQRREISAFSDFEGPLSNEYFPLDPFWIRAGSKDWEPLAQQDSMFMNIAERKVFKPKEVVINERVVKAKFGALNGFSIMGFSFDGVQDKLVYDEMLEDKIHFVLEGTTGECDAKAYLWFKNAGKVELKGIYGMWVGESKQPDYVFFFLIDSNGNKKTLSQDGSIQSGWKKLQLDEQTSHNWYYKSPHSQLATR